MGGWILQKQQISADESYRDPTNLQSKIQKHAAFESELAANKSRVGAVTAEGEALINGGHFAAAEIQTRLNELEAEWRQLQESSALKRERLNDAYQVSVLVIPNLLWDCMINLDDDLQNVFVNLFQWKN